MLKKQTSGPDGGTVRSVEIQMPQDLWQSIANRMFALLNVFTVRCGYTMIPTQDSMTIRVSAGCADLPISIIDLIIIHTLERTSIADFSVRLVESGTETEQQQKKEQFVEDNNG